MFVLFHLLDDLPHTGTKPQEPLDSQATSRLAGAFSTIHLRQGETVAVEGGIVDRCFMIEYGSVEVRFYFPPFLLLFKSRCFQRVPPK